LTIAWSSEYYGVASPCRGGRIGRHQGLTFPCCASGVRVRCPSPAYIYYYL